MTVDRTIEPAVKPFGTLKIKNVNKRVLPNGLEVFIIDSGDQPLNRITFSYPSGLLEAETPDALQLATQLMREGTEHHSGKEISEILDFHGAWLKADAMSHDTVISLWSMNNSTAKLIPLLREIIERPVFPEKEFEALRQKHKAKYLLSQKNVLYMASLADKRLVFGENHPMCRVLNADEIDAITAEDLRKAYGKAFGIKPYIFISGGELESVIDEIVAEAGKIKFNGDELPAQNIVPMHPVGHAETVATEIDAEHQSAIVMSIPVIGRDNPDYIPLRLVVMALGGYFGSRLMSNIREDKGYTYGIQASLLGYREGGVVSIMTNTAPEYVTSVIAETKKEIARLQNTLMDDEELANVKSNAMTSLAAMLDTPFQIMDYYISQFYNGTPPNYFADQVAAINALTAEQIMELSRKYLDIDRMLVSIAGPAPATTAV